MIHINNIVDKIKALESQNSKQFSMTMREAKDLHADITKLLLALQVLQNNTTAAKANEVIQVELRGDTW
jgi:uncharacterized protein YbjQ (UPF0145 family)